jgi:ATP-dependent RNA helicase DeaD
VTQDLGASGLDDRLAATAREIGYERLTPLQAAAMPVLRRGGNVVLNASSGAGVTVAYGLPLLDRLLSGGADGADAEPAEASGPRGLVLVPTAARVETVAAALARLAEGTGIAVRAIAAGWRLAGADVVVTTADRALREVQASALKLDAVATVVIADLAEQLTLETGDALATVSGLVPRDAQRVVTSGRLDGGADRFIEAHVRRAFTVPSRPADPTPTPAAEPVGQIGYLVLAESEKPELLARLLEGVEGSIVIRVRNASRGAAVRADLIRRGVTAAGDAVQVLDFTAGDDARAERVISYDVPFSGDDLRRLHETGGTVFVTPAELQHFRRIAGEVPFTLKQRRARQLDESALDAFRQGVRSALAAEDLGAQLLVLDPLFDEHSPAEVAAALGAMLRRRQSDAAVVAPAPRAGAEVGAAPAGPPPREGGGTFTRLFMSIGSRDNVRPGDVVGAITGEAGIRGEQVGRVDIRDSFSVVEVAADVAERVIRALNGTTMRGRSLRVDYDRKGGPGDGGGRSPRQGGSPRTGGPRGAGGPGGPRRRPPAR